MSPASNSRRGEQNHLDAGLDGGIEEHPVVGIVLGVPEHHLGVFEGSRGAAENGQVARFKIVQDFALECVEIQVHVASSALNQHQNIRGAGQVAGRRRNDRLRPDVDLTVLFDCLRTSASQTNSTGLGGGALAGGGVFAPGSASQL